MKRETKLKPALIAIADHVKALPKPTEGDVWRVIQITSPVAHGPIEVVVESTKFPGEQRKAFEYRADGTFSSTYYWHEDQI